MKSTVETLSPTRVRFEIEVPFVELEPSLRKAYRDIGAQVSVPGFRKGKVPAAVIDRRVGREKILSEAVNEAIPGQFLAAVRLHEVRPMGRPAVEITDFADGQPLKFSAEVDVRPSITLPDVGSIDVTVDAVVVNDTDVDAQVDGLRQRFASLKTVERPAQVGDYVQIDLAATVDGVEVPGGSATNLSHEVGSNQLLPNLDETLVGMAAGQATTFISALVAGEHADRDADVAVTVRTVRERELPAVDDEFAQLASEFDTLAELRDDLAKRLARVKRVEQLYAARDKTLKALLAISDVPAPQSVVAEEAGSRKQAMTDQLERMGTSLAAYLSSDGKTEEEIDAEFSAAAEEVVKIQLLLDSFADAEAIAVTDDEFGQEVAHRAQRAGVAPQQYYDQLTAAGAAGALYGDVRRGKALSTLLERVSITDSAGARVSLDELRRDDTDDDSDGGSPDIGEGRDES